MGMHGRKVFLVGGVRTPIGGFEGTISSRRSDDLGALVVDNLIESSAIDAKVVDGLNWASAIQTGEDQRNVGASVKLLSGLSERATADTANDLCGSSFVALMNAFFDISCGYSEVRIAGGSESMSRAYFVHPVPPRGMRSSYVSTRSSLGWPAPNERILAKYPTAYNMLATAEAVMQDYNKRHSSAQLDRVALDNYAVESHARWGRANEAGVWDRQIVPVSVMQKRKEIQITRDEMPNPDFTYEDFRKGRPSLQDGEYVTRFNACGPADAAAAVLLASERALSKYGLVPMAEIIAFGRIGLDPGLMGYGPRDAIIQALTRADLESKDMGRVVMNEAFAAQVLPCIMELGFDQSIVNINGGAIAFGHPLGATGGILATDLLHQLHNNTTVQYGVFSMCVGLGEGGAGILRNVNYEP